MTYKVNKATAFEAPTYSPEEIRKWKKLIYGQNADTFKVDDWASTEQSPRKTSSRRKLGSPKGKRYSSGGSSNYIGKPGVY